MDFLSTKNLESLSKNLIEWSPKLVAAILVFIIGFWIVNQLVKVARRYMERSGMDKDVIPFLSSMLSVLLKLVVAVSAAGLLGIETTSFVALLGMLGLAIGMALQGTLGHFASGVMILLFKPYKVGDLVELDGNTGHVEEIQVFNTILRSPQNQRIIIPNGQVTGGTITNKSAFDHIRIDLSVMMAYVEDFERIQEIIVEVMKATPKVLNSPEPQVEINSFGEYNINLDVYPYAKPEDYWAVYYGVHRNIKAALDKQGIQITFPEYEVVKVGG